MNLFHSLLEIISLATKACEHIHKLQFHCCKRFTRPGAHTTILVLRFVLRLLVETAIYPVRQLEGTKLEQARARRTATLHRLTRRYYYSWAEHNHLSPGCFDIHKWSPDQQVLSCSSTEILILIIRDPFLLRIFFGLSSFSGIKTIVFIPTCRRAECRQREASLLPYLQKLYYTLTDQYWPTSRVTFLLHLDLAFQPLFLNSASASIPPPAHLHRSCGATFVKVGELAQFFIIILGNCCD